LTSAIHSSSEETARPFWRRRLVLLSLLGWTVFVGLAVWWLMQGNPRASLWIIHDGESARPIATETVHAWFRSDIGVQRVYPWILLGPYVALVAICFPLERGRLRLNLAVNLGLCLAFLATCGLINARTRMTIANVTFIKSDPTQGRQELTTIQLPFSKKDSGNLLEEQMAGQTNSLIQLPHLFKPPPPPPGFGNLGLWPSLLDLLAYGAVAGLAHSVHFYRRFREREHRALFLESTLANARLNALRAQLHPHFLFNSLNAIATLLRRDPRLAETTLLSLSDLLRITLSQSERQEVALREELQFIQRYLEIQQTRFGDKLRVEQVVELAVLDSLVPTLLLQPLVENAIQHGIEPAEHGGIVRLTAHRRDQSLILTVEDNGVGLTQAGCASVPVGTGSASEPSGTRAGTGIGLANLRARLDTLYGPRQKLELIPRPEGGLTVRIEIPWHQVTSAEAPCASSHP